MDGSELLISMNIHEGGQESGAVFWLLSHRSSVAGSTAGQMTEREKERERHGGGEERERYACVWDLKGTAPGCLGYLCFSKAMRCLERGASYVLNAAVRAGSIRLHLTDYECEDMSSPLTC